MRIVRSAWPPDIFEAKPKTVTSALRVTETMPYKIKSHKVRSRRKRGTAVEELTDT